LYNIKIINYVNLQVAKINKGQEKWALYHASPFLLQLKLRYQSFIGSAISKIYEGILSFDDLKRKGEA
jgi:hypothetical protein